MPAWKCETRRERTLVPRSSAKVGAAKANLSKDLTTQHWQKRSKSARSAHVPAHARSLRLYLQISCKHIARTSANGLLVPKVVEHPDPKRKDTCTYASRSGDAKDTCSSHVQPAKMSSGDAKDPTRNTGAIYTDGLHARIDVAQLD